MYNRNPKEKKKEGMGAINPNMSFRKIMKDVENFEQLGGESTKKPAEKKRKPKERVLKSTVENFKRGVLDVRHLLHSGFSRTNDRDKKISNYGKIKIGGKIGGGGKKNKGQKKRGKKNKGKKKGGGKRKGK